MATLGIDVGGANLKVADGSDFAVSRHFPLWTNPNGLTAELNSLLAAAPDFDQVAVTMTGELADCYETRQQGVEAIITAVGEVTAGKTVRFYLADGRWVSADEARKDWQLAGSSNWHALASYVARFLRHDSGMLIDIGSTTTDLIPLVKGVPHTLGRTDSERLVHNELVYTGVQRSPVCALVTSLPWGRQQCPVALEMFATTWDAYLVMDELPEEPDSTHTADRRPATKAAARSRLARCICADRESFSEEDAKAAAVAISRAQQAKLGVVVQNLFRRLQAEPETVVISGRGEFLARHLLQRLRSTAEIVSLADELTPDVSECANAYALAVLASEQFES